MKNLKNWTFRLFIYVIIVNAISAYIVADYDDFLNNSDTFIRNMSLINILSHITLVTGLIFATILILKKQLNDKKTWISVFGLWILFFINVTLILIN